MEVSKVEGTAAGLRCQSGSYLESGLEPGYPSAWIKMLEKLLHSSGPVFSSLRGYGHPIGLRESMPPPL